MFKLTFLTPHVCTTDIQSNTAEPGTTVPYRDIGSYLPRGAGAAGNER